MARRPSVPPEYSCIFLQIIELLFDCIEVTSCWLSTRCFLPNALRSWGEPVEQGLDALFNTPLCVASALHKILHGVLFLQNIVSSCILINVFAALCVFGQTGRINKEAQRCADSLTSTSASCLALDSCGHAFLASFQLAMTSWRLPPYRGISTLSSVALPLPYDLQASKSALPEDWGMGERLIGRQA